VNGAAWFLAARHVKRCFVLALALLFVTLSLTVGCGKSDPIAVRSNVVECTPPAIACNGRCADIASDQANCGGCGTPCPAGDTCVDGACKSTGCPAGRTDCGGLCVDLETNPLNCGSCNTACAAHEACANGSCTCAPPGAVCASVCTDLETSVANCGACGHACAPDELCSSGSCQPRCALPLSHCGGSCVDLTSDPKACGTCQTACSGAEICNDGHCECPNDADHALCGSACVDLRQEADHCGGCGNVCSAGLRCANGLCTPCSTNFFFCPSGEGDPLQTCLAQARDAKASGTPLPDLECQCRNCLVELQDCVNDGTCVGTWQCALRNACTTPCWGTMGVCSLGGGPGCFKWCPPTGTPQTAARVEALMRCTRDKGCGT
jgi:hypothetical protein